MKHAVFLLFFIILNSIAKAQQYGSFKDPRDGRIYKTVTIGTQVWMNKNLNVSTFRNGDPIPQAKTNEEWEKAGDNKQPAWCYYENDPANGAKYGKLYNWYAVSDSRGLAPVGYHIPSDAEWTILTDYLGGAAGAKMKSKQGWAEDGNGTNSSGFSGLPGGYRYGSFFVIGLFGSWWSSTEFNANGAWYRYLHYKDGSVMRYNGYKEEGFSVRCLRD
ncbi:MAG: fibrobacter succinogenes major paralogous domain-containing protein [Crocinitomicaceae bacterium]